MNSIVLELFANAMDIFMLTLLFTRRLSPKYNSIYPTVCFVIIGFFVESIPSIWSLSFYPVEIIMIVACGIYLYFFREGKLLHKFFWLALSFVLIFSLAFVTMPLVTKITGVSAESIYTSKFIAPRALYITIVNILKFTLFFPLSYKVSKIYDNSQAFLLCIMIPVISVVTGIWILNVFVNSGFQQIYERVALLFSASFLTINILSFLLYDKMEKDAEEKMYLVAKQSHYDTMEQYTEQIRETNIEIREWQHDIKQHLTCMRELISKKDYDGTSKYLEKFTDNIKASYLKINTGNYIADAVLSSKISVAIEKGITFDCNASLPKTFPIDDVDFCSILSNIIENAIEACEKVSENPYIRCNIETIKNQLIIEVENSSNGKYKMRDGYFESQKKERLHGIGLRHTQSIIETYDGICSIRAEENIFKIEISIPLKTE